MAGDGLAADHRCDRWRRAVAGIPVAVAVDAGSGPGGGPCRDHRTGLDSAADPALRRSADHRGDRAGGPVRHRVAGRATASGPLTVPSVALSTASVWPERVDLAFELAADLGYDGVEVMVWTDPASQDLAGLARLSDRYGVPILALHAPCLLISQRVW